MQENNSNTFKNIKQLIEEGNITQLRDDLNLLLPTEVFELIEECEDDDQKKIFSLLNIQLAVDTFKYLEHDVQSFFLESLS